MLASQIPVNRLDPTHYLQATSRFQSGEPFGSWFHVWENFTWDQPWPGQLFRPSFRSHQRALGNLTNEWTPMRSKTQYLCSQIISLNHLSYGFTVSCVYHRSIMKNAEFLDGWWDDQLDFWSNRGCNKIKSNDENLGAAAWAARYSYR